MMRQEIKSQGIKIPNPDSYRDAGMTINADS